MHARPSFLKQPEEVSGIQQRELRSQAIQVTAWLERPRDGEPWEAHIRNASDQPIFDVRTFFYEICKKPGEGWEPVLTGGPPPRDETICVFPRTDLVPSRSLKESGCSL